MFTLTLPLRILLNLLISLAGLSMITSASYADPTPVDKASKRFVFAKNSSEYVLADKTLYKELDMLSATKPKYSPGIGVGNLSEAWASVGVCNEIEAEERYRVIVCNCAISNENDKLEYRLGVISLSKITVRDGQITTLLFGLYDNERIVQRMIEIVCAKTGLERPKAASDMIQVSPRTRSIFSLRDDGVHQMLDEALKVPISNLEKPKNSPEAEVFVYSALPPFKIDSYYKVYLYASPGVLRIEKLYKSDSDLLTASEIGIIENKEIWLRFCERFATPEK